MEKLCAAELTRKLPLPSQRCLLKSWVKENIKKKRCCFYREDDAQKGKEICMCGYQKRQHTHEAFSDGGQNRDPWDRHKHICQTPTDAFGYISFGGFGQKTGKYVRVSSDTPIQTVYQLMTEHWKLHSPNLLISVTGGAVNFTMNSHLKSKFRRGLRKVAETTGAWIITGGTHAGVMKHVGAALREYTLSSSIDASIVAIGVATWGILHNRECLINPDGCFPAHYTVDEQSRGRLSCLDNNHSHFLLVDDGTHGHYGVEIKMRSKLEKFISEQNLGNRESGVKIPVVCVVVNGGPGTLDTIYNAMLNGTPCVTFEGSGRIADVIAQVAGQSVSSVSIGLVQSLLKKYFSLEFENFSELKILEWTKKIQDILRMPHLLTVFSTNDLKNNDVDVAILQAFLKASRGSESFDRKGWERQLELAVAWNRVDIAENEILTDENQWKSSDLHKAMFSALIGRKPEMVRLLFEKGVSIWDILSEEMLCDLYANLPSCFFMRKLAEGANNDRPEGENVSLRLVSAEVQRLLGSFTQPIYPTSFYDKLQQTIQENHRDPGRDLFLWAIVQHNKELAEIAWEQSIDSISAALAASKMLKKMALVSQDDEDNVSEMRELARLYEKRAIGVFSECHKNDEHRAQKLLIRISPSWGNVTCLRLALEADDKDFVAHSGVQALLTQIWYGELSVFNPQWKLMLTMFFFPLIYSGFITFRHDETIQRLTRRKEKLTMDSSLTSTDPLVENQSHYSLEDEDVKPLSCYEKLVGFYTAPQIKFFWNILSYFGFLLLFSIILMIDFQPSPSWKELLLYVWMASLVLEEIRQLFDDPDGLGINKKAKAYICDLWNILDVLSISVFIAGLVCRLTTTALYAGKVILCIDFIIFCLRLMAIFIISKTLGPKIIIVKRMMMDLFFFMFLLSIWVVAYGVAKQGILIDNEDRLNWIVRGALYEPYLIIFGNLPTDTDITQFDVTKCTTNGSDALLPRCPVLNADQIPAFPEWLTIIMLCVYLLFANILLLNLLIAIFNYTFQEVQDNTDTIWKLQRYELIKEYQSRPSAPPPFILFEHLCLLVQCILKPCCKKKSSNFREQLSQAEEEGLLTWEAFMKDNYLMITNQERIQSMEYHIQNTSERVYTMSELLERKYDRDSAAVGKKLNQLEQQVFQCTKSLKWIMDALKSQGYHADENAPSLNKSTERLPDEPLAEEAESEKRHVYARHLHYPDSNVTRFPVPEEKVPWEVDFPLYMPTVYEPIQSELSRLDEYRNPGGRTGVRGRGALSCLGPNPALDIVITLRRDKEGSALRFLAAWNQAAGGWSLPGGDVAVDETLPERLKHLLGNKIYHALEAKLKDRRDKNMIWEGYADDPRNTDNAWVHTTVYALNLDNENELLDEINHVVAYRRTSSEQIKWQEVNSRTPVPAYQREALQLDRS
uniref:Transient receptor potential cation channel subfamily M member 2 n=1 Tax=Denticeps clupeoides TaxID=299321 RepID=A0AAY4EJ95_9TELE